MIVSGVEVEVLKEIAAEIGARLSNERWKGNSLQFNLRPTGELYRTKNPATGRKGWSVCWHGQFEFFKKLFKMYPETKVRTEKVDYNGAKDFCEKAWGTGMVMLRRNPNSSYYGWAAKDCCSCKE